MGKRINSKTVKLCPLRPFASKSDTSGFYCLIPDRKPLRGEGLEKNLAGLLRPIVFQLN